MARTPSPDPSHYPNRSLFGVRCQVQGDLGVDVRVEVSLCFVH